MHQQSISKCDFEETVQSLFCENFDLVILDESQNLQIIVTHNILEESIHLLMFLGVSLLTQPIRRFVSSAYLLSNNIVVGLIFSMGNLKLGAWPYAWNQGSSNIQVK